jgi:rhamnulokinase
MQINTLYQLLAAKLSGSPLLDVAEDLLLMPDLLGYFFSGEKISEFTIATTTQMFDPRSNDWAWDLIARMGLSTKFLKPVTAPGTVVGPLLSSLAREVGAGRIPVIATAGHDTGAAVAAVPASGSNHAYISSGTWSLIGVEIGEPSFDQATLDFNLTNEGGVCGTFRLLKNVMGLWLVQQCKRAWERAGQPLTYDRLTRLAAEAKPLASLVDPDDLRFLNPDDMPVAIREVCAESGQTIPETEGAVVRCVLESLALKSRWVLAKLEAVTGRRVDVIHVVGGGAQNRLLCQLTADATGLPVVAGPVEATAIGNIMVQALALGEVGSLAEIREVVRNSQRPLTLEPVDMASWDEAYGRFVGLVS